MVFRNTENKNKSEITEDHYTDDFEDGENLPKDYDRHTAATLVDHVLLNRPLKAILALLVIAVFVPTLLYGLLYAEEPPASSFGTCVILPEFWSECVPGKIPDKISCEKAQCCWNSTLQACFHSIPAEHSYRLKDPKVTPNPEDDAVELEARYEETPFNLTSHPLFMRINALNVAHVIMQLSMINVPKLDNTIPISDSKMEVELDLTSGFWVTYWRREPGEVLWSTKNGPVIASDGFWEISLQFPENSTLLGSGSASRRSLSHIPANITFYAGVKSTTSGRPFILCIFENGRSHGVLFDSPGAMELVSRTSNLITLRSTANTSYTLHTFVGDSPSDVIKELTKYTGRVSMPPYWTLGLHVCRDAARNGSNNSSQEFRDTALYLDLPYDSDCIDDSALGNTSFVLDIDRINDLKQDLDMLKNDGRHFLFTLFAQVTEDSPAFITAEDFLLKDENSTLYLGLHRDYTVGYPDYFDAKSQDWLRNQLADLLNSAEIYPSGLVLPDNWPLNDNYTLENDTDSAPYVPQALNGTLSNATVWWLAEHSDGSVHHTRHASYGTAHSYRALQALADVLRNEGLLGDNRLPVFTSSKWAGDALHSTWMGEEHPATWEGLKSSLMSVLEAGMSGEPLSGGGPVCGARGEWSDSLCTRWSLLAVSSFPTVRYHHAWGEPSRDPASMTNTSARVISRAARLRYQLLPYIYTLVYEASLSGMPVVRPMALEFPTDNKTWPLDEQFMLGSALMVAPAFNPADVAVTLYLPQGAWYSLQGGERIQAANDSGFVTLLASENELLMFLRGGKIIVMQEEGGLSTADSLLKSREILVGLNCVESIRSNCSASGVLYLDDGKAEQTQIEIITMEADPGSLLISRTNGNLCPLNGNSSHISKITMFGLPGKPIEPIFLNTEEIVSTVTYDATNQRFHISDIDIDWCEYTDISISWAFDAPAMNNLRFNIDS